jgi:outer membrane lipoprotein-sorting protein
MKKPITLLVGLLLFGTIAVVAQDAKAILDQLSKKAEQYKSMKADFSYQMLNKNDGIDDTQKGSIITQGEKYHLNIAGQEIISNGKTMWTVINEAEEVQVNTVPEESELDEEYISPTKILTLWEKGFKYKYDQSTTFNGQDHHIINLYPQDPEGKSYHTIKLYINKSKMEVSKIIIKGKDGTDFIYTIKNFQTNESIPPSTFSFNNPDYEVIDLR